MSYLKYYLNDGYGKMLKKCFVTVFIIFFLASLKAEEQKVFFDKTFMRNLNSAKAIERDSFFEKNLNSIIQTRAVVVSLDKTARYKRLFRLVLEDKEAEAHKMKIIYNVFFNKEETRSILNAGDIFEFSGQLVSSAPLNTARTAYILDIILQEGALLIE